MIHCGRCTTSQVVKILGIFQILSAIIITATGIGIVIKFRQVHHDLNADSSFPDNYVDEPWTTKYGAAIWMGLIMAIAGALGCFADVKPHKSKYIYGTIVINIIVVIAGILLLIFSQETISWFDTCKYTYHVTHTHVLQVKECTDQDKSMGTNMYWTVFIMGLLMIPITIAMLVFLGFSNSLLIADLCEGNCFRKMIYEAKGSGNTSVSFKTKNTHEFDKEIKDDSLSYSQPAVYC